MSPAAPVRPFRSWLASVNGDGTYGVALAGACLLLLASELGGEPARLALRYERAPIAAGELWRLLTGHFVHLSFHHALLNVLGLALMWALFARDYPPRRWLLICAASIAVIDVGLWLGDSTVQWYVGSSGLLHGIMAAGTLAHLRRRQAEGWILAVFLVAKLCYEQFAGPLPFVTGATVVVDAHLYGAVGGLAAAVLLSLRPQSV